MENNKLQDEISQNTRGSVKKNLQVKNHKTDIASYLQKTKIINKTVECKNETTKITSKLDKFIAQSLYFI